MRTRLERRLTRRVGPAAKLMLLVISALLLTATDAGAASSWSAPRLIDGAAPYASAPLYRGVSCPSAALCVIADSNGNLVTSTKPFAAQAGWRVVHIPIASAPASGACGPDSPATFCFSAVSCPTATFCVAAGSYDPPTPGFGASGPVVGGLLSSTNPAAGPRAWALTGTDTGAAIDDLACPSIKLCVAVDSGGNVLASTTPAKPSSWTTSKVDDGFPLTAISCPQVKLCVAVDNNGRALASTKPAGGAKAWHLVVTPAASLSSVSCPSTKLCLATDAGLGKLVVSTNPAAAKPVWRLSATGFTATAVYCASVSLCFASDSSPSLRTTSTPTNPSSWQATATGIGFTEMSCVSTARCLEVDSGVGPPRVSATPTGASTTWTTLTILGDGANSFASISCPSTALCVAGDNYGRMLTFSPATGLPKQITTAVIRQGANIDGISCRGVQQCVAVADNIGGLGADGSSLFLTSVNPAVGTSAAWRRIAAVPPASSFSALTGVSCPTVSKCVASDLSGQVWQSLDQPHKVWTGLSFNGPPQYPGSVTGNGLNAISCLTGSVCVAGGYRSGTNAGATYSSDGLAWLPFVVDAKAPLNTIACPSAAVCVAGDSAGDILTTGAPLGGNWTVTAADPGIAITAVACPRSTVCVAVDAGGNVLVSHNPSAAAPTWTATPVDPGGALTGVSCPTSGLCVAVDSSGQVVIGRP
jgi:hypothetical protein